MLKMQIGTFPGRLNDYTMEDGTTVAGALRLAGLTVGEEQEVKVDGEAVDMDYELSQSNELLLITKRLKGAC